MTGSPTSFAAQIQKQQSGARYRTRARPVSHGKPELAPSWQLFRGVKFRVLLLKRRKLCKTNTEEIECDTHAGIPQQVLRRLTGW